VREVRFELSPEGQELLNIFQAYSPQAQAEVFAILQARRGGSGLRFGGRSNKQIPTSLYDEKPVTAVVCPRCQTEFRVQ
jgi:hypothetical protein